MKHVTRGMAIFAILAVFFSAFCFAESEEIISIEYLKFESYVGENGETNDDLLTAEIKFSSAIDAEQFSIILSTEEISEFNDSTASKIVYIDQFASTENDIYRFTVEKSRIASAINSTDIDSTILYVKMGGMGIDEATFMTVVYNDPQSKIVYGDISGDGIVSVSDVIILLKTIAAATPLTEQQKKVADVNCDGHTGVSDAIRILKHIASPDIIILGPSK